MTHQAQTIQIFLPQGEPRGIRIADITTRIVQVVVVPWSKLLTADREVDANAMHYHRSCHDLRH